MVAELIIILGITAGVFLLLFFLLRGPITQTLTSHIVKATIERVEREVRAAHDLLGEKMKREEQFVEGKKDEIKELITSIREELARTQLHAQTIERERIGEFNRLRTVLDEQKALTHGLKESTDDLKNLLSNNQLRGRYGQEVAENLLKSAGFVKGQTYVVEKVQDSASTRPDFTILLPDKTKIHVDVKFPLDSLVRHQEAEKEVDKERYLRQFTQDVKQKIREVSTRDYINPEEDTVDFVILFVPNEMVFSFIYDQLYDVWNDAMEKKVILAGPFSFTAILRMVFQSYTNFTYQKNIREIIRLFRVFDVEYEKYNKAVDTLGTRIQSVASQYEAVAGARTRKLSAVVEKIRSVESLPPDSEKSENLIPESNKED